MPEKLRVGVIGVGSMGRHHARIYNTLPNVELVGVCDLDEQRVREVAEKFQTRPLSREALLEAAEAVSIAVPTRYHTSVAKEAIEEQTHLLIEKPLVVDVAAGRELLDEADDAGLTVQVGHIERYNPAILALRDVLANVNMLAVAARRQGPPVDRDNEADVIFDLMIHDIDIMLSLTDSRVTSVSAARVSDQSHVVAQLEFSDGLIATLTSSRITQDRIRELAITAQDCQIEVDYMAQSVEIHRHSFPEYITTNGDVKFRHESVVERPTVENGEPLKKELESFVQAVMGDAEPETSGWNGLRAVKIATQIKQALDSKEHNVEEVLQT